MKIKNWLKIHRHIDRTQRRSLQQIKEYDKIVNDEDRKDVEKAKAVLTYNNNGGHCGGGGSAAAQRYASGGSDHCRR